ncbi:MAG: TPM domain-containing protein [Bacteroidales bacterium]|nr:TPM domain-containing protein [Bacteroidales bacterium]
MSKLASTFFSKEEKQKIMKAIAEAENESSGEIRVHIENKCAVDVLDCASHAFAQLKMHKTKLRNGVLFYFAIRSKKFAIIGDIGINQKVPENFWDEIKEEMQQAFLKGDFVGGLAQGIIQAGQQLKEHFPHQSNDINELNDEISFG